MPKATTWCAGAVCASVWCVAPWCVGQDPPAPWVSGDPEPTAPWVSPSSGVGPGDPTRARRVLLMSLAGAAGGFGGALGGVLLVAEGGRRLVGSGGNLGALMLGGTAGYLAGLSLSVTLAGYAQGGNGGYGWVLLGGLGGTLVLGGLGALSQDGYVAGALALAGGVGGAVLAYELSNDAHGRLRRRAPPRVLPTVSADATGLRVGLGGTF